jgi:hypothetical protein
MKATNRNIFIPVDSTVPPLVSDLVWSRFLGQPLRTRA